MCEDIKSVLLSYSDTSSFRSLLEFRGVWKVTGQENTVYIYNERTDNNINVDWGDGSPVEHFQDTFSNDTKWTTYKNSDIKRNKNIKHTYKNEGSYIVRIWGVMKLAKFKNWWTTDNAGLISVQSLGYLHWENFQDMFWRCKDLTTVEGGFTHKVTDMSSMFGFAKNSVPNVTNFKTDKVTDMSLMFFEAAKSKPDTSLWKIHKDCDIRYFDSGMFF